MKPELVAFLLERIAEDEDHANEAGDFRGPRLLAEVEAKREILRHNPRPLAWIAADGVDVDVWDPAVLAIANIYADHPDFNEGWRP